MSSHSPHPRGGFDLPPSSSPVVSTRLILMILASTRSQAAMMGLFFSICLSCTYFPLKPAQTLSRGWALLEEAAPLACSTLGLPTSLRLHNLGYTAITPQEGVFWAEGWSSGRQRLLVHAHARHMHISTSRHVAIQELEPGERALGIYLAPASQGLLLFKAIETHTGSSTTAKPQPTTSALGTFELTITDLMSTTEQLRTRLDEFMYASDLAVHPLNQDTWILSGYVDNLLLTMISIGNNITPYVNTFPPEFALTWASPQGLVVSRLNQDTLTVYTSSSKNQPMAQAPSSDLTRFQVSDITLRSSPEEYALALMDEHTLLIAYTAPATSLTASTSAPKTPDSPLAKRELYLGTFDLTTGTLTMTHQLPLDSYLTYQNFKLKLIHNRWYLLFSAALDDQQVVYSYNLTQLTTPAPDPIPPSWWPPKFLRRTTVPSSPRRIFGPLTITDHLIQIITYQNTLTFLLKHSDGRWPSHYSTCTLSPSLG